MTAFEFWIAIAAAFGAGCIFTACVFFVVSGIGNDPHQTFERKR